MRSAGLLRTVAVLVVLVGAVAALTFSANAVLRPGCSLLPVSLSGRDNRSPATLEQACAVLGRPLPRPAMLPDGARLAGVGIDDPPLALECCREVRVAYSLNGRNFASLGVRRQDAIPVSEVGRTNAMLGGVPAIVNQTRPPTLDADDVLYLWARDGLLYTMHVRLPDGVTRETADAMAASIR